MNQNQEKLESELFQQYQLAIDLLENGDKTQGISILKDLMQNQSILNQDDKKILYGIYMSLAEIQAQSDCVDDQCEALYYYYQSTLIQDNCWQTQRKMSLIFRQLGMMPRALNVILKALQLCNQPNLIQVILYQVCSICFLMNDQKQFEIYFDKMSDQNNLKMKIAELRNYYINQNNITNFVKELLEEKSQIQQKLERIPFESDQKLKYFNQSFQYEIILDTFHLNKFFKKIQNILKINVNFEPKQFDFIQNDKCFITNTKIIVISKEYQQNSKDISKELPKENQPVKQSERQKSKKTKQQQDQQFVLDQSIQSNHNKLIELIKQFDGNEIFQFNNNTNKIQNEQNENQECSIAKFLLENLNGKQFLTIIQLIENLITLIFQDYHLNDDSFNQQTTIQNEQQKSPQSRNNNDSSYHKALRGLINCVVWAQYSTNKFTNNPKIKLRLLEVAYEELNFRFKEKKPKSPEQQNKIKNFIRFINNLKLELLQTNINQIISDKIEAQNYLLKYYKIMANIHSDINFFQGRIAKLCAQKLNNSELVKETLDKIKSAQFQISSNSPHQSQQIQSILTQWEQKEQRLEDNEKIRTQINYVKDNLNQNYDIVKRLAIICLNQFYFAPSKEELKVIYKFLQPLIQQFLNIPQSDLFMGFIFLKFSIIFSLMDQDSSEFLAKFIEIFLSKTNGQNKHLILIEILNFHHLNISKLFTHINIDIILQEFIQTKIKMKNRYVQLIDEYKKNFSNNLQLHYYLINLLDFRDQYNSQFIVEQKELQIEVEKTETKYPQPESFSSASEEEVEQDDIFQKQYQDLQLTQDQIENIFTIGKQSYQYPTKTIEFLLNHKIKVNIGDPKIIEQIKRFAKETIKFEFGLTTKDLTATFESNFLNKYYLQSNFERDLSETELQFMGFILPHFHKIISKQKDSPLTQFIKNNVKKSLEKHIDPIILEFVEWLFSQIFTKQKQQNSSIKEFQDNISQNNLQSYYKSNLYYLIQKSEVANGSENLKTICYALAYKESPLLWKYIYKKTFKQALNQFQQKQITETDWFLSQKKIYAQVNKNPLLNHLNEYRYIMDLIKLNQRQVEYQHSNDEHLYKKTEQGYLTLYQKQFNLPKDAFEIENNFRILQLYEKKVMRKYRIVSIERIKQNLDNINSLVNLIKQMKKYEIVYFYESTDGEQEMRQDLYINIYKFIKRFLRHKLYNQLNQLIQIIKDKYPHLLLNQNQSELQFEFQYDDREFKISNFTKEQLEKEENTQYNKEEVNIILNSLLSIFVENTKKLMKKKIQRYTIEAYYYATHLKFNSQTPIDQVFATISQIYQPNTRDLVYYYVQYDKIRCEKDKVLDYYYSSELIYNYQKSKILKLIIKILLKRQKYKDIYQLFEKLHKVYDIRLYQACIGLLKEYKSIDDKNLIINIIQKTESYRRTIELFKQEFIIELLNNMYIRLNDLQEQNEGEIINESQEKKSEKLEKGKKIFDDYRAAKRKPAKPKEQQQQIQQQQTQISEPQIQITQQAADDDVGQHINQGTNNQSFNDFDNM